MTSRCNEPTTSFLLDLGCANGINAKRIFESYSQAKAVGVDISPKMVAAAETTGVYQNVFVHDISQPLEFLLSAQFDLVIAFGCLEFVSSPQTCLNEISRVLRIGGRWFASFQLYVEGRPDTPRTMHSGKVIHHAYSEAEINVMIGLAGLEADLMEEAIGYTGGAPCPYLMVRGCRKQ